jgi:hypothetical protein
MGRHLRNGAALVAVLVALSCSGDESSSRAKRRTSSTTDTTTSTVPIAPTSPTAAEAGGWRLAVTRPTAGAMIGTVEVVCYEVAGATREPVVALEVTLLEPGATTSADSVRVEAAVGRGSARVDLGGWSPGRYDLRVQLIGDGARREGVAVTIPAVTLASRANEAACP